MTADNPFQAPKSAGIHVGNVGGSLSFNALGDIVAGNKIVNVSTTIQISVDNITQRPFVFASPYRGLDPFRDRDKDLFFGRDQLINSLISHLGANNVLLVLGASGSGKSSVVRAGLLPALSKLIGARFRDFTMVPDANPFVSLRSSLQNAGFSQSQTSSLVDIQPGEATHIIHSLKRSEDQWLIFIDQFEEIFTRSEDSLRERFVSVLLAIVRDTTGSTKVIMAMRADFLDRFSVFPQFAKLIEKNIGIITNMHADELRLAIEQPAARHGVVFQSGLVEEIIKDVEGQAGSLPLLQYTLDLLWQEEREKDGLTGRCLRTQTYRELGGVRGALQKRAEEIYASFGDHNDSKYPTQNQEIIRQIFLCLVDIAGSGTDDTVWRPVRRRRLIEAFSTVQEQKLLQELISQKLLVSDREGIEATVEVAHEAIFTSWNRFKSWIEGGREVIFAKNRLADDSFRWQQRKQEDSGGAEEELYRGSRLAQALEMRDKGEFLTVVGRLDESETQFLDSSVGFRDKRVQEERQRQQRESERESQLRAAEAARAQEVEKRRKSLFRVCIAGAAFSIAFSIWALISRNTAHRAAITAIAHSVAAEALLQQGPTDSQDFRQRANDELAALLARQSFLFNERGDGGAAHDVDNALRHVLAAKYYSNLINCPGGGQIDSLACSPNGQWIAVAASPSTVYIWKKSEVGLRPPVVLSGHTSSIRALSFSADSTTLASAGDDKVILIWTIGSDSKPRELRGHKSAVTCLSFSRDGRLASGDTNGTVKVWNINSPDEKPAELPHANEAIVGVAFTSDDNVLYASRDGTVAVSQGTTAEPKIILRAGKAFNAFAFAQNRNLIACSTGQAISLWIIQMVDNVPRAVELHSKLGHQNLVNSLAFDRNGDQLISTALDGTIRLWRVWDDEQPIIFQTIPISASNAVFTPDGLRMFSDYNEYLRLWDLTPPNEPRQLDDEEIGRGPFEFSGNGKYLASVVGDQIMRVHWLNGNGKMEKPEGQPSQVQSIAVSGDSKWIAAIGWNGDVVAWEVNENHTEHYAAGRFEKGREIAFSKDGKNLVIFGDHLMTDWNMSDGHRSEVRLKGGSDIPCVFRFSPDYSRIWGVDATGAVWEWDLSDKDPNGRNIFAPPEKYYGLAEQSLDGRYVAVSDLTKDANHNSVFLFDRANPIAPSRKLIQSASVAEFRFSEANGMLAVADKERNIKLWRLDDPTQMPVSLQTQNWIGNLAFDPGGRLLAAQCGDGTIWVFTARTSDLAELITTRIRRNLSHDEWKMFIGLDFPYEQTCPDALLGK